MHFIVTGGLGYIGSVLTQKLIAAGHHVTVWDKGFFATPRVERAVRGARIIRDDILNLGSSVVAEADWVFHLAAVSNDPSAELSEEDTRRVNVTATQRIGRACARARVPMVFASTASVYGFVEWELCREDGRLNPQSIYGRSKVEAEAALRRLGPGPGEDGSDPDKPFPLRCIIMRQATVYGWSPRMRYDLVVNTLLVSALKTGRMVLHGGGECWRPLVYVGDVADAWIKMAERATEDWWKAQTDCPTFNLIHHKADGKCGNYRISELAAWMALVLAEHGVPCEVVRDTMQSADNRSYAIDGSRAQHAGLICPTGITPAIEQMLTHIRAGDCADLDHPRYRNHDWLKLLQEIAGRIRANEWEMIP